METNLIYSFLFFIVKYQQTKELISTQKTLHINNKDLSHLQ